MTNADPMDIVVHRRRYCGICTAHFEDAGRRRQVMLLREAADIPEVVHTSCPRS